MVKAFIKGQEPTEATFKCDLCSGLWNFDELVWHYNKRKDWTMWLCDECAKKHGVKW